MAAWYSRQPGFLHLTRKHTYRHSRTSPPHVRTCQGAQVRARSELVTPSRPQRATVSDCNPRAAACDTPSRTRILSVTPPSRPDADSESVRCCGRGDHCVTATAKLETWIALLGWRPPPSSYLRKYVSRVCVRATTYCTARGVALRRRHYGRWAQPRAQAWPAGTTFERQTTTPTSGSGDWCARLTLTLT